MGSHSSRRDVWSGASDRIRDARIQRGHVSIGNSRDEWRIRGWRDSVVIVAADWMR